MHTRRGASRLAAAFAGGGSAIDPRNTYTVSRKFRLRRGVTIQGAVTPIVQDALYRVGTLEGNANKHYKEGGYLKLYVLHHDGWAVDPNRPETWLYDYCDDAHLAERSLMYQTIWGERIEIPRLEGVSFEIGELFRMAVRLRKADPRAITKFEAKLEGVLKQLASSGVKHERLLDAFKKLETIAEVNLAQLPQQYPVIWCSQDRVDDTVSTVAAGTHKYGRLGDAMKVHNRLATSIVRGLHDDLDQMAESDGDFAAGNRAERLEEYRDVAMSVKARPWTRVLAHVERECGHAAELCAAGQGEAARAEIRRSVRSLKTVTLSDEVHQVYRQLGVVEKTGVIATSGELESLGGELLRIKSGLESNRDDDMHVPVLPRLIPAVTNAHTQVLNANQGPKRRVHLAISNLRPGLEAV